MQPSTETTQTPSVQPRTSRGGLPTPPARGAADRFDTALTQALEPSGPAATVKPTDAAPAAPIPVKPSVQTTPALPPMPTATISAVAVATDHPIKDGPESAVTGAKQDEPSNDAGKTPDLTPVLAQPQPVLPTPLQALTALAQTVSTPAGVTESPTPAGSDSTPAIAVGSVDCQTPSTPAATAAQPASQPMPPASALAARATPSSGAGVAAVHTGAGQPIAAKVEDQLASDLLGIAADAGPAPAATLLPVSSMAAPTTAAPHHASVSPAAASRPSVAGEPPASVASQVGPALASFVVSAAHPGGPQNMVIRLDPLELGRVQVRIERSPDGSARVDLVVERPDTLLLLLRDQPHLHRALDLAGVPSVDRTLQFHLTLPDATTPSATAPQSNAEHGPGQQRPGQPRSNRSPNSGTVFSLDDPTTRPLASRRAGVDITA